MNRPVYLDTLLIWIKNQIHMLFMWLLLVGCLTSQQQASVPQERMCSDKFTCCHTEVEDADQTFYLIQSQYTDTGLTSPSADPGRVATEVPLSKSLVWLDPEKSCRRRISNFGSSVLKANALITRPTRQLCSCGYSCLTECLANTYTYEYHLQGYKQIGKPNPKFFSCPSRSLQVLHGLRTTWTQAWTILLCIWQRNKTKNKKQRTHR